MPERPKPTQEEVAREKALKEAVQVSFVDNICVVNFEEFMLKGNGKFKVEKDPTKNPKIFMKELSEITERIGYEQDYERSGYYHFETSVHELVQIGLNRITSSGYEITALGSSLTRSKSTLHTNREGLSTSITSADSTVTVGFMCMVAKKDN